MNVVILCGGREKHLIPMTSNTPLGLMRITGKPLIEYILDQLKSAGINEATFAIGRLGNMYISEYINNYNGIEINFTKTCLNGTAGALKNAYKNDDMLVIEANSLFNFDLKKFFEFHSSVKSGCTIVTKEIEDYTDSCCLSVNDNGKVISMSENPSVDNLNTINAFTGIYIISKNIFEDYLFDEEQDFISDILPQIISHGGVIAYKENGYWQKILSPDDFLKCQIDMLNCKTGIPIDAKIINNSIYSDTESNFNSVSVLPPVYIGKNVTIQSGAVIGPNAVIDDNALVNSKAQIANSYIGQNAIIKSMSWIESAMICNNAVISSSAYCGENSVIGEKAHIGENAKISEGIKIWPEKKVEKNSVVRTHVKTGLKKLLSIDDECECDFSSENNVPTSFTELGMSVGTALNKGDIVIVGHSDTQSSETLSDCMISGLLSTGIKVYDMGVCTNQQIMFATCQNSCKIGCYTSADYSVKIKLMDSCGLPITHNLELAIEKAFNNKAFRTLQCHDYGIRYNFSGSSELYTDYLNCLLPRKLSGINADIRCSSIQTAKISDKIIYPKNDINGEHIVFHVSADGSSCSAYTDKTNYVFHEALLLLAIKICCKKNIAVSVPYSFPVEAEIISEQEGGKLYRYYNCSDDDSDNIARDTAKNPDNLFVRDGLMLACVICDYLSEKKITLYEAIKELPSFATVQRYVSISDSPTKILKKFAVNKVGYNEGIVYEKENSRAIIRPLKNRKGLMIFAESSKSEQASAICDEIQEKLKKYENNLNP